MLSTTLIALSLALPAGAASPSQRPRSLQEVIDLAMAEGEDRPISAEAASNLGLGDHEFPHKRLRYKQAESPDRKEHTFAVLYTKDEKGAELPQHLLLTVGTGKKDKGVVTVDSVSFLMALDGSLKRADHDHGHPGEIERETLKLSPRIRKQAQAELTFHTKVAFALNLRPAK